MSDIQAFVPEAIQAHFDEASYLFVEFYNELSADRPDKIYLGRTNDRLVAHLDGLLVNASAAWDIAEGSLDEAEMGEAFVISYLAFASGEFEKVKPIVERALEESELFNAVAYGLSWHPWDSSGFWAEKFVSSTRPGIAAMGLFCYQTYQQPCAVQLTDLVRAAIETDAQASLPIMLKQCGKVNEQAVLPILQSMDADTESLISYESILARIQLNDATAMSGLKLFVMKENEYREHALNRAFSVLSQAEAKVWMSELRATENADRYVLLALAAMGESSLLPYVVKQMEVPELARIAGMVFSVLSGKNLRENDWVVTDDRFDEAWLDIDGDEELDWPDVEKIRAAMGA